MKRWFKNSWMAISLSVLYAILIPSFALAETGQNEDRDYTFLFALLLLNLLLVFGILIALFSRKKKD